METEINIVCDWKDCDGLATKHVSYGFRQVDSIVTPTGLEMPYTRDHNNFCDIHLDALRNRYHDTSVSELGECSQHCDETDQMIDFS